MKQAILLVTFGTSVPEAQRAFEHIDVQTRTAFPGTEIRWAYTSPTIRKKLSGRGIPIDSPEIALARLMDEGYRHAAVLSLHTIPGIEFHNLCHNAKLFERMHGGLQRVVVARPLLSSQEDMGRVIQCLLQRIPQSRGPQDGVLFMGHGSRNHPAGALYSAMNYILQDVSPNTYVATAQGHPTLSDVLPRLVGRNIGKVYLMPFMSVAGEHARKDMAGEQRDSWKSVLSRHGFECRTILTGTAEYPEIVAIWLDHLREVLAQL
ncbi:sirohydrochlorin cobaltochelatase [Desulfoferrobacter suflitae]|uniref:sirohydrochlorin cobaltochelatase n=1 Tax=Desulfoferrobacter suflitae TaxID=2865782 RepID=UPI002164AA0C|nr:sirohydrochlorin cobaltochelatase [Desulfoferrobacter suflitae]MCK8600583.1 sirohydrochlorin cobaltochelatase [Desulfoferrobacter suflitae]